MLGLLGGVGATLLLAGCGDGGSAKNASGARRGATTSTGGTATTIAGATVANVGRIPEETAGPFPGDGSNGPNVLKQGGIVRNDIRSSFGSSSTVAKGLPLTISLALADTANGGRALAGAAVYVWHCDINGGYSMYSQGLTDENYLRGVQVADANGVVNFTSIFPAAYSGRWPHIHFQVYPGVAAATNASNRLRTSQLALPADVCAQVYATDGYGQSVRSLSQTSLQTDNVFSDGSSLQVATVTGTPTAGYAARLTVGV
jgi:protocatechuate 3,4-dioxygenase beta subunit